LAAKELEAVAHKRDRQRLVSRVQALSTDPRPHGCEKLSGYADRYRVRQGDYRVVCSVDDARQIVLIVKVGHRRDVYR
jgi:mRNA interferase RelE/StbE